MNTGQGFLTRSLSHCHIVLCIIVTLYLLGHCHIVLCIIVTLYCLSLSHCTVYHCHIVLTRSLSHCIVYHCYDIVFYIGISGGIVVGALVGGQQATKLVTPFFPNIFSDQQLFSHKIFFMTHNFVEPLIIFLGPQ